MAKHADLGLGLALICACLVTSRTHGADAKFNVTGTWNCEVEAGGTQGTPVFTFKQDGDTLTGKYKGQFGEADVKGKVDGDKIEFSFEMQGLKVAYKGTIEKDAMKGEVNYGDMADGTWKGKKAADDAKVAGKVDLTGVWALEVDVQENKSTPEFTFKHEGDALVGKYKGQFGELDVKGKVNGDKVEFAIEAQGMKIAYKGTVENDTMKGEISVGATGETPGEQMATGTWKGKKKPAEVQK